jgi:hypothetical protein
MKIVVSVAGVAWILGMLAACSVAPEPMRIADPFQSEEKGATNPPPTGQEPPPEQTPPTTTSTSPLVSPAQARTQEGYFIEPGIGFTSDPGTFLLAFTAGKFITPNVAIGPLVQLGVSDSDSIFAPALNVRGIFDIEGHGLERVKPYVEGGAGLIYLNKDHHHGDDDEWGFLIDFGFGANVELDRNITLGTGFIFNLMPSEVVDERFIFSWKILQLSLYF